VFSLAAGISVRRDETAEGDGDAVGVSGSMDQYDGGNTAAAGGGEGAMIDASATEKAQTLKYRKESGGLGDALISHHSDGSYGYLRATYASLGSANHTYVLE